MMLPLTILSIFERKGEIDLFNKKSQLLKALTSSAMLSYRRPHTVINQVPKDLFYKCFWNCLWLSEHVALAQECYEYCRNNH